jgi:hypothetical protein
MAGIVGVAAAQGSGTALATTAAHIAGGAASGAASGVASTAAKTVLATGASGFLGGMIGAVGGLGGAFLGTWLPAELAPTGSERNVLRTYGRSQWRAALVYTFAILAATPLLFIPRGWLGYFAVVTAATLLFIPYIIIQSIRAQRSIRELRASTMDAPDPNPSETKRRLVAALSSGGRYQWIGRRYTSRARLLGLPLIDLQVSDPSALTADDSRSAKTARGWIAIGDRAHGILLGIGGRACGIVAIGGAAFGVLSFGGIAVGLFGIGGLAVGALSLGGLAAGHTAIGGVALGWAAAGGAAIGWHSAAGGLAIAHHAALGGLAVARDFAVGGAAYAAQINTPEAREMLRNESLQWVLDWIVANQWWFILGVMAVSACSVLPARLMYRRVAKGG